MEKEEVVKKTVHEFKKFARQNKFWEEYKRLSCRLGQSVFGRTYGYRRISFIQLVEENEPVELIQGTSVFCSWPCQRTSYGHYWLTLSKQWAYTCLTNGLFYDELKAINYVRTFISTELGDRYLQEKKELQLEFK